MTDLERLDICLGDALELLMTSAELIRRSEDLSPRVNLKRIGDATNVLWEIREEAYAVSPRLKRGTQTEAQQIEKKYESMNSIAASALEHEIAGRVDEAIEGFERLKSSSTSLYFRRLAEAGLFRVAIASQNRRGK